VEETLSYNRIIRLSEPPKAFIVGSVGLEPIPASEAKSREDAAREAGKREALEEARREFQRMRTEFGQRHEEILASVQKNFSEMAQELMKRLPEVTLALTERVLGEIQLDRDLVVGIVTDLISEFATEDEKLEVYLCPEDLEILKAGEKLSEEKPDDIPDADDFSGAMANLFDGLGGDDELLEGYPNVAFHADADLGRGDCQIKSRFGLVDGRILTKLSKVSEELDL
jgi:flagellar biosynthesis/type III secretory pathway protein FliH